MSEEGQHDAHVEDDDGFYEKPKEDQDVQDHKEADNVEPKPKKDKKKTKTIKKREKGTKKSHNSKEQQKEMKLYQQAQQTAEQIIKEMDKRFSQDIDLQNKKQVACKKFKYIDQLSRDLKNVYICEKFLEQNGLQSFEKWLGKVTTNDGSAVTQPSLALRKGLFQILLFLKVRSEHIVKAQQLQRIIQKHKRSQIKELRDLSEKIIAKWSRLTYEDNDQ